MQGDKVMEDGISFFMPDGRNFFGRIEITRSEMFVFKKSKWVVYLFGLIGNALAKGKEELRIQFGDIAEAKKERYMLNKNAYYVTMRDGYTYILIFDHPKTTIEYLESVIGQAAKQS